MVSALLYAFGYQVEPCAGEFLFDLLNLGLVPGF